MGRPCSWKLLCVSSNAQRAPYLYTHADKCRSYPSNDYSLNINPSCSGNFYERTPSVVHIQLWNLRGRGLYKLRSSFSRPFTFLYGQGTIAYKLYLCDKLMAVLHPYSAAHTAHEQHIASRSTYIYFPRAQTRFIARPSYTHSMHEETQFCVSFLNLNRPLGRVTNPSWWL